MRILVAGIGNLMMSDDGVGVAAVERLQDLQFEDVHVVAIGTAVLRAEGHLAWADRVLAIDALEAGGRPGSIRRASLTELEAQRGGKSLHGLDLLSILGLLPEPDRPIVEVIGVEPERIEFGLGLSPSVKRALPRVERLARSVVKEWSLIDALP